VDRARDALVIAGQESDKRDVEDARVELLRAVVLRERPALAIVTLFADFLVDLVADLFPAFHGRFQPELMGEASRAIEHGPGHHRGVGEVATRSARLPDAIVRLTPDRLDVLDHRSPARPQPLLDPSQ